MLMGRTITLPLVGLARCPRTSGYRGPAKAYAVQQYGDRRQYCHLNTFAHGRVLYSRIVTTVQCSPRAIKPFSYSHPSHPER
jgi:hypothetical protein